MSRLAHFTTLSCYSQVIVAGFLLQSVTSAQNLIYSFRDCAHGVGAASDGLLPPQEVFGATISIPAHEVSADGGRTFQCSAHFQVPGPEMMFLIQLNTAACPLGTRCSDQLKIHQISYNNSTTLLSVNCTHQLPGKQQTALSMPGTGLWIQLLSYAKGSGTKALQSGSYPSTTLILTAVLPPSACSSSSARYFLCSHPPLCISASLRCDGTSHCPDGSDEHSCMNPNRIKRAMEDQPGALQPREPPLGIKKVTVHTSLHAVTTVLPLTTPVPQEIPTEESSEVFQEVDMVSIIVVGVLFIVILMICIILACRSKGGEMEALSEESNQLRLDVSTNVGVSGVDGAPATPPPTYSMIERQTSYVSQISMSSSQVSEPPDYDEALELDAQGNPRPRRTSSRRHSSTRTGVPAVRSASAYSRNRPRQPRYRRSQSETSERPRFMSQNSAISEVGPIEENQTEHVIDDLFVDVSSNPLATPESPDHPQRSASTPTSFENPVTSTPHLAVNYDIEMIREDSTAPLFHLTDTPSDSGASSGGEGGNSASRREPTRDKSSPDVRRGDGDPS